MDEVYLRMGRTESLILPCATIATHAPENSTAAMLENIFTRLARIETRLIEHERREAATVPPLRPEPDPPDGPPFYTAAQPPYPPYQPPLPPYQPDRYPPHNSPGSTTALGPQPYPTLGSFTLHRNSWSKPYVVEVSTDSAPPTPHVPMPESYHCYPSPAAGAVRQPPQFQEPISGFNMTQHQVSDSTPTYIASAISPTPTPQSRSCHGRPMAVLQPLISPPSHCRSAAMLPAAAPPPPLPHYMVTRMPYGDQLPVNGSPEINADDSQRYVADSDGNQTELTISDEENSNLPFKYDGKVIGVQTGTEIRSSLCAIGDYMSSRVNKKVSFNKSQLVLAAKKPLHSIVETRPGKGAPEEDFEEELYNAEIDPAKDPQELVVSLKIEQCLLIEGKRSAELRTEELVLALMEMVKQDNHRQLGAKVEQMQLVEKHEQENTMSRVQHGLPSVIFYGNNEGRRPSIRCTFDPGGMPRQSFCFQLSLLLRDSHLEDKVDFNRGGVDTLIIPYSSISCIII